MRLIDADRLEMLYAGPFVKSYKDCREELHNAPTIDAVPVVHGRWKKNRRLFGHVDGRPVYITSSWTCSECGMRQGELVEPKFCYNCGAKMDGDTGEDT